MGLLQTRFSTRFVRNVFTCASTYLFGISIEHMGLLQTRFSTRFVRVRENNLLVSGGYCKLVALLFCCLLGK